ncbi:MAG: hypothetical protein EBW39_00125 [Betaproteobacteria bacterium]|nr:hypothetical protein [Betaproteobacteria bacterium]
MIAQKRSKCHISGIVRSDIHQSREISMTKAFARDAAAKSARDDRLEDLGDSNRRHPLNR